VPGLSQADHSVSPPSIIIPRDYNVAHDLVERNLARGARTGSPISTMPIVIPLESWRSG